MGVIDEDLEISHEDLAPNIIEGNSYDVIDGDYDPSYPEENIKSGHGTGAAGIIAARGWNDIGTRGVAPKATLSGCNYLEATSFENWKICFGDNSSINQMNQNDIFNISLGSYGTGGTDKDENDEDIEAKKFASIADFSIGTSVDIPSSVIQIGIKGYKAIIYDFANFNTIEKFLLNNNFYLQNSYQGSKSQFNQIWFRK